MNFKKMTYLCMQRLTNFPYIEEDFDALTDYELLCKVVEYLNNVIKNENNQNEAIAELANEFIELKNYVDNLDLQEEVNNKLDEMVTDGTIGEIINQEIFGQINSDITNLYQYTNLADKPTLFIGDSYTNPVQGYAEYYKSIVGLSDSNFFKYASGGAGFYATGTGGNTFIDLLDDAIDEMTQTQRESIKQIIVGSCLNDANYSATVTQIKTGMTNFMNLVYQYFPNSKVYIMACGYRVGTTQDDITARYNMDNNVMNVLLDYSGENKDFIFIDNSNLWLRNSDWFNVDNIHPNDTGQRIIANHLIRALQGNTEVFYNDFTLTISVPKEGATTETFNINGHITNNILHLKMGNAQRLYNLTNISVNTLQEIGTWSSKVIHTSNNSALDIPVCFRIVMDGPIDNWVNGFIRLAPNGKVYIFVYAPSAFANPPIFSIQRFNETYSMYML